MEGETNMLNMKLLLLSSLLLFQSCFEKTKSQTPIAHNTPKCPPFVYKYDTGKTCGKIVRHKINSDTTLGIGVWSNDSVTIEASMEF